MSWSKHTRNTNPFGDLKISKDDYLSPADYVKEFGHHVDIAGAYINRKAKHGAHPVSPRSNRLLCHGSHCKDTCRP